MFKRKNYTPILIPVLVLGLVFLSSKWIQANPSGGGVAGPLTPATQLMEGQLMTTVSAPGIHQELKVWDLAELARLKRSISREKDPKSGKVLRSEGVLLTQLIDQALEKLPLENRAQIDLIVLKNTSGQQAMVPRALMIKYPLLIAFHQDVASKQEYGPLSVVVPWTSRPKILSEDLPLEKFFVSHLAQVELTNYRHQFGALFLKRRTDPKAMRGEKLFVQSCAGCHEAGRTPSLFSADHLNRAKVFAEKGHPGTTSGVKMNERDRVAILRYAEALHAEQQDRVTQVEQPGKNSKDL